MASREAGVGYHRNVPFDLEAIRQELPILGSEVYLNTGGTGPLPIPVVRAINDAAEHQLGIARMGPAGVGLTDVTMAKLRAATAKLVGGSAADMAITSNTTIGLDVVIWGIDWMPGDHIITLDSEHPGLSVPIATVARRFGLEVTRLTNTQSQVELEEAVRRAITPRTRLVALSHVTWSGGAVLDIAGAARAARDAGALIVIDGAQAVGSIPVDVHALGVHAYSFPAQKWLLGPEGVGALWICEEARLRVDLTFCAYEAGTNHQPDGTIDMYADARRYEISTPPLLLVHGWLAGLAWLESIGWDAIHAATAANMAQARSGLGEIPGVTILTPDGPQAGLVVFQIDGREPEAAFSAINKQGVCLRWLNHPPAVRASMAFFCSPSDHERLLSAVRAQGS